MRYGIRELPRHPDGRHHRVFRSRGGGPRLIACSLPGTGGGTGKSRAELIMTRKRHDPQRSRAMGAGIEPSSGQRRLRVGEELRHALSKILREGECRNPALDQASITVTEVRMSQDLRNATAFVMPLAGANAPRKYWRGLSGAPLS